MEIAAFIHLDISKVKIQDLRFSCNTFLSSVLPKRIPDLKFGRSL